MVFLLAMPAEESDFHLSRKGSPPRGMSKKAWEEEKVAKKKRVNILTVCGVGSGSSLILRMYTEDVLEELGLRYKVSAGQASEARGTKADIVMCAPEFAVVCQGGSAEVVPIKGFTDKDEIRETLTEVLKRMGFIEG